MSQFGRHFVGRPGHFNGERQVVGADILLQNTVKRLKGNHAGHSLCYVWIVNNACNVGTKT
jgi:hypothetical protein